MRNKFCCFLVFIVMSIGSYADKPDVDTLKVSFGEINYGESNFLSLDDSIGIVLPSVGELIENSKNSAQVLYYQSQMRADELELKSIRRKWMDCIKFNSSYQYGLTNSAQMFLDTGIPTSGIYTNAAQSYFLIGVGISLPLSEVFDRNNKIKKQKMITREKDYQAQMWHNDQSLKIVDCYTCALENISMIQPLQEDYTLSKAQYQVSEIDFVKGKISVQELNKQKTILLRSQTEYQKNKMTLIKNILQLEILSSTKILIDK